MKKVLHIALGRQNPEMEKAISLLGETKIIDWTTESHVGYKIVKLCTDWKPDLVFMQLQGSSALPEDTIKRIREVCDAILINWTGDVREDISWYKTYAKHFHYTLFTNETDVQNMRNEGFSADYLQVGFQENIYNLNGEKIYDKEIVFMANNYPIIFPLSELRKDITYFLKVQYGDNFGLYGFGWVTFIADNINSQSGKEAAIYRGAKIGISISHFDYERYYSDRQLRIMACGCFCLSYHYKGIEKDFKVGKHLDTFRNKDELKEKIDYYLTHEEERKRIANAGQKYVWDNCRWEHRVKELKKIIGWH